MGSILCSDQCPDVGCFSRTLKSIYEGLNDHSILIKGQGSIIIHLNHSCTYVCMASMASMLAPCSRESIQASNSLCVGSSVQSLRARIFWCAREQQSRDVCIRYYLNSLL